MFCRNSDFNPRSFRFKCVMHVRSPGNHPSPYPTSILRSGQHSTSQHRDRLSNPLIEGRPDTYDSDSPTPLSQSERGASAASGVCPGRRGPTNQTTTIPSPPQTSPSPVGRERVGVRARGGAGPHANQTPRSHHRNTPNNQHPITAHHSNHKNHSSDNTPTKQPRPHHRSNTLIRHKHSPSPVGRERVGVRARGGEGHANQTTTSPSSGYTHPPQTFPLSRWTGEGWGEGPGRRGAHQPNNHPLTAATPSPTTIIPSPSSQPVGAGFKPALTKHPNNQHPITPHHEHQRNQRFRLDFHTTYVV